jgi:tRNA pseudouridine32 synthase/23S rRNA pseudouridine746 synthase
MTHILELSLTIKPAQTGQKASRLLAEASGLSQAQIKDAMHKGAVWLRRGKGQKRLRRAGKGLQPGDVLLLNHNPAVLNQAVPVPELVDDAGDYSIWFKPFGLACQGSRWGDFASIQRWVEVHLPGISARPQRPVHLVHRLDRATTGLLVLCHSKQAARAFSQLFAAGAVDKRYQAIVHGHFTGEIRVEEPVDGKAACSVFTLREHHGEHSLLDVQLLTGRKHQIRKHLSGLGMPIVGDRLYGTGDQDGVDLQLQAVSLAFLCPFSSEQRFYQVRDDQRLVLGMV